MTVYRKISLFMLVVFVAIYLIGALLFIHQARFDVQRELEGVSGMAANLAEPSALPSTVVAGMRHLRPETPPGEGGAENAGPSWFYTLIVPAQTAPVVNGWQVDPGDEIEEIWESFVMISGAYALGMALCFVALFLMVRGGLGTLAKLSDAMGAVSEGRLTSRLPSQHEREFDALIGRFNHMADALELEQQTVSRLLHELLQLQDREREHIARVLHDDLGQYLTGIRAQARSLVYDAELSERQQQQARDLASHCETIQTHFRHLLQELHPLVMEQLGLVSAIRHLAEQWQRLSGLECRLDIDTELPEFTGEQQTHLYRFLQEALNNVSRHANASCATLAVVQRGDALNIEVQDDGIGSESFPTNAGLGLRSMRERARCLGGDVQFLSQAGKGTRVRLALPLSELCASAFRHAPGGAA